MFSDIDPNRVAHWQENACRFGDIQHKVPVNPGSPQRRSVPLFFGVPWLDSYTITAHDAYTMRRCNTLRILVAKPPEDAHTVHVQTGKD